MTKPELITAIKQFDTYKDVKDYILNKKRKNELEEILSELKGSNPQTDTEKVEVKETPKVVKKTVTKRTNKKSLEAIPTDEDFDMDMVDNPSDYLSFVEDEDDEDDYF